MVAYILEHFYTYIILYIYNIIYIILYLLDKWYLTTSKMTKLHIRHIKYSIWTCDISSHPPYILSNIGYPIWKTPFPRYLMLRTWIFILEIGNCFYFHISTLYFNRLPTSVDKNKASLKYIYIFCNKIIEINFIDRLPSSWRLFSLNNFHICYHSLAPYHNNWILMLRSMLFST